MNRLVAALSIISATLAAGTLGVASADAAPAYDVCGEAQYVTDLFTHLFHADDPADRSGAAGRAQLFAANAPLEVKTDAYIEAYAETAVLDGVPSDLLLRTDPVFQAWGDVMDWHTGHCLPQ